MAELIRRRQPHRLFRQNHPFTIDRIDRHHGLKYALDHQRPVVGTVDRNGEGTEERIGGIGVLLALSIAVPIIEPHKTPRSICACAAVTLPVPTGISTLSVFLPGTSGTDASQVAPSVLLAAIPLTLKLATP